MVEELRIHCFSIIICLQSLMESSLGALYHVNMIRQDISGYPIKSPEKMCTHVHTDIYTPRKERVREAKESEHS